MASLAMYHMPQSRFLTEVSETLTASSVPEAAQRAAEEKVFCVVIPEIPYRALPEPAPRGLEGDPCIC